MGIIDKIAKFETELLTNEELVKSKLFQLIIKPTKQRFVKLPTQKPKHKH